MKQKRKWVKTSEYGDYRDPKQNHKREFVNPAHTQAVRVAWKNGVKHPGSKKYHALKRWL